MNTALKPPKAIGYRQALDMMGRKGTRLVKMRSEHADEGFAYYVVPGGYVEPSTAEKIKAHPYVQAMEDGLFPGHDQTWRMLTHEPQPF